MKKLNKFTTGYLFTFLCLITIIFTVACVNATEIDNNITTNNNEINKDINIYNIEDEVIMDNNINTNHSMKELNNYIINNIKNAKVGDTIKLENNYYYLEDIDKNLEEDDIIIDKPITIDGQGHTIDAKCNHTIFKFKVPYTILVKLINIRFVNGSTKNIEKRGHGLPYGSSVFNSGGDSNNIFIKNCTFINNTAQWGGAVYNCYVENCTFIDNTAKEYGGAIRNCIVTNCRFIHNEAEYGGAILGGSVTKSYFFDNIAKYGGAMSGGIAKDCTFTNNKADDGGGAMHNSTAEYCTFTNNIAIANGINEEGDGGAMSGCIAKDCYFINNKAKYGGAMIGGIAKDCYFINNSAYKGGAIYYGKAINCTFINNTAMNGNAMYFGHAITCKFINSKMPSNMGYSVEGIAAMEGGKLTNCSFVNNTVSHSHIQFSIINKNIIIGDSVLFNYLPKCNLTVTINKEGKILKTFTCTDDGWKVKDLPEGVYNITFSINSLYNEGELNITNMQVIDVLPIMKNLNILIKDTTNNRIFLDKDYQWSEQDKNLTKGIIVNKSITIDGQGHKIDANNKMRIFQVTNDAIVTFKNINFLNGEYKGYGGAVLNNGAGKNVKIINCTFNGNRALNGTIVSVTAINCTFINNTVKFGAAIYYGEARNCIFTNNTAKLNGGAIYYGNAINCTFNNNNASGDGGAMYNSYAENCIFNNNTADHGGGAMYNSYAENCIFNSNHAQYGGAIYIDDDGNTAINCIFNNNTADYGGAIYLNNNSDVLSNLTNIFVNNIATKDGGAIYIHNFDSDNDLIVIRDCIFINNGNTTISTEFGNVTAINCWFGNNATNYKDKPQVGDVSMSTWLFLNATANPTKIIGKTSIIFKLDSYNNTSKKITLYNASKTNLQLALSQTLGKLDKNISLIGENIIYTAGETGDASVTGKIGTAYYIISFKNNKVTLIDIINTLSTKMSYDIIKYLKMQQKYSVNTNSIALDVKYLQNLL